MAIVTPWEIDPMTHRTMSYILLPLLSGLSVHLPWSKLGTQFSHINISDADITHNKNVLNVS